MGILTRPADTVSSPSPTVLEFAALHKIKPVIQTYPMTEEGITEAMNKLDRGEVHFRAVIVPQ